MIDQPWKKSSYCGSNACVEVVWTERAVLMRDAKNPGQPPLAFSEAEWSNFLLGVRAGEFDRP